MRFFGYIGDTLCVFTDFSYSVENDVSRTTGRGIKVTGQAISGNTIAYYKGHLNIYKDDVSVKLPNAVQIDVFDRTEGMSTSFENAIVTKEGPIPHYDKMNVARMEWAAESMTTEYVPEPINNRKY